MTILVTGASGYIGSHTTLSLLVSGYDVIALDNLSNSSLKAIKQVEAITGKSITFIEGDIRDRDLLSETFQQNAIQSVMHFAGLKAVGESVDKPLEYYNNNVTGTLNLLEAMQAAGTKKIVFSSSATVYGLEAPTPYHEDLPRGTTLNPYGNSKAIIERILEDLYAADPDWSIALLRYFNPVGAHESGLIGEDPRGIPNNLMPYMAQVAVGRREYLSVYGGDYPTTDGTCRRDYLHVMDLAEGHAKALEWLQQSGCTAFNLGTSKPVSVLEMIRAFEHAIKKPLPYKIVDRRDGDLPEFWASADRAKDELGWVAKRSLKQMMEDTWRWQSSHPNGFG